MGVKAGALKKDGTPAKKCGAPAHAPTDLTRRQVEQLAGLGVPHEHIAVIIGLSDDKTLRHHYQVELKMGKAKANSAVAKTLFQQATEGKNTAAAIFWAKSQMGWREVQTVEHTGPNGGPIQHAMLVGAMDTFFQALYGAATRRPSVIEAQPEAPALEHAG